MPGVKGTGPAGSHEPIDLLGMEHPHPFDDRAPVTLEPSPCALRGIGATLTAAESTTRAAMARIRNSRSRHGIAMSRA